MTTESSIYELIEIEYRDESPQCPEFEVNRRRVGCFSSLAIAEQAMKNKIEANNHVGQEPPFGFLIEEYALDVPSYWWTESIRSYLPDGVFLDETLVSDMPDKDGKLEEFFGRPPGKVRFASGCLVEAFHGDTVTLSIVTHVPFSPEEVREIHERSAERHGSGYRLQLDASDDCYRTIEHDNAEDNDTHTHPHGISLFPLRFPVSDELRKKCAEAHRVEMKSYEK